MGVELSAQSQYCSPSIRYIQIFGINIRVRSGCDERFCWCFSGIVHYFRNYVRNGSDIILGAKKNHSILLFFCQIIQCCLIKILATYKMLFILYNSKYSWTDRSLQWYKLLSSIDLMCLKYSGSVGRTGELVTFSSLEVLNPKCLEIIIFYYYLL